MDFMPRRGEKYPIGEKGVSEVVGVILIIGLIVAVFATFYPIWRQTEIRKLEAEHMNAIRNSFSDLKSMIGELEAGDSSSINLKLGRNTIGFGPDSQQAGALSVSPANLKTIRLYPIDDAYVVENLPQSRFGENTSLWVASRRDNNKRTFLKFSLESIPTGTMILKADLWLYCDGYGSPTREVTDVRCYSVDNDDWLESNLAWENQPPMENALDSLYVGGAGWISLTAKDFAAKEIIGNKIVSLGLRMRQENYDNTERYINFSSKEATGNRPYLEVVYAVGPGSSQWPVQSETVYEGGTTGISGAQHDDGVYENIFENAYQLRSLSYVSGENVYEGGTSNFSYAQADDGNYENIFENAYRLSIAFDAVGSGSNGGGSTTISWSHTTGSGSNMIMVVGVAIKTTSVSVSSITYGSQSLTFIRSDTVGTSERTELWYLVAPISGTARVTVNLSGSSKAVGGSMTYTGVAQTSPIDANNGATGTGTSASVSVTVNTDQSWLVGVVGIPSSSTTITDGASQNYRWDQVGSGGGPGARGHGHGSDNGPVGTGSRPLSWTLSDSYDWAASVVAIKPATFYRENVQHNITGIPAADNYQLQIKYYTAGDSENVSVYLYNFSTSGWDNKGNIGGGSAASPNTPTYDLTGTNYISGGAVQVRYVQPDNDRTQTSLMVDYTRIAAPFYRENVQHDITGIPAADNYRLQIKYYTTGDSEAVSVYIENFISGNWDNLGNIQGGSAANPKLFTYSLTGTNYISSSGSPSGENVYIRYVQPDNDFTRTSLMVNYCRAETETMVEIGASTYGTVKLDVTNEFYPSQTYVYEGGGIIMIQDGVDLMASEPTVVTASDAGGGSLIRVDVNFSVVENRETSTASTGTMTIHASCKSSRYVVTPVDVPNRENVVVTISSIYNNAWSKYLQNLCDDLNTKGYNASFDGLTLTILGKNTGPGVKDIYYYEKLREIEVFAA